MCMCTVRVVLYLNLGMRGLNYFREIFRKNHYACDSDGNLKAHAKSVKLNMSDG